MKDENEDRESRESIFRYSVGPWSLRRCHIFQQDSQQIEMVVLHCIMNSRETRGEIMSGVAARNNAGSMNGVRGEAAAFFGVCCGLFVSCLFFDIFRWLTEEYEIFSVTFELESRRRRTWSFDR